MNTAIGILGGLVVGAGIGWGVATQLKPGATTATQTSTTTSSTAAAGSTAVPGGPLFELDGQAYSDKDLPAELRTMIYEAQNDAHERVTGVVSQFALQLALARDKDKNAKPDALPPMQQLLDVPKPSEDELKQLFEANKSRLPPGMTYEQVKGDIEKFVSQQKVQEAMHARSHELTEKGRFKVLAAAPVAPIVQIDVSGFPAKGTNTANVVVEAADYVCPHCQEFAPQVEAMIKDVGSNFKFVAVNYSLNPEGLSGMLARGAYCAMQQGDDAFWKYHEHAFKAAKEKKWKAADPAAKEPLAEVAKAAGLDQAKLDACVDSPEAKQQVDTANERMEKAGVTGTPTFFVNGRKLTIHGLGLKDAVMQSLQAGTH